MAAADEFDTRGYYGGTSVVEEIVDPSNPGYSSDEPIDIDGLDDWIRIETTSDDNEYIEVIGIDDVLDESSFTFSDEPVNGDGGDAGSYIEYYDDDDWYDYNYDDSSYTYSTDSMYAEIDADNISISYQNGDNSKNVTQSVTLPRTGLYGSSLSWYSSDEDIISNSGTVHRPTQQDAKVTLWVYISKGDYVTSRTFSLTVKAKPVEKPVCNGLGKTYYVAESGSFTISGSVSSSEKLKKVTVNITNATGIVTDKKGTIKGSTCDLSNITFNMKDYGLKAGTYTLKVWVATDSCPAPSDPIATATVIITSDEAVENCFAEDSYIIKADIGMTCQLPYAEGFKYSSSNTKIAKVSKTGVVTTKKAGTATITVTYGKQKAKFEITVVGEIGKVTDIEDTVMYSNSNVGLWYGGFISGCDPVRRLPMNESIVISKKFTSSTGSKWYITADGYYVYSGDVSSTPFDTIVDIARNELAEGNQMGGLKYRKWYYGYDCKAEWCACFVSYCANRCGYINEEIFPRFAGCDALGNGLTDTSYSANGVQWFKDHNRWQSRIDKNGNTYTPVPGDIIFFDWNRDGGADHVGIVVSISGNSVVTIEGNTGSGNSYVARVVKENYHNMYSNQILGYGLSNGDY